MESSEFLSRAHTHRSGAVARKRTSPLAWPTDGEDRTTAWILQIKIGPAARAVTRFTRRWRRKLQGAFRGQRLTHRFKAVGRAEIALDDVQYNVVGGAKSKLRVKPFDVLEDTRVVASHVPNEHGPFHDRIVKILDHHTADDQAGGLMQPNQCVFLPAGIQIAGRARQAPRQFM